MAMLLLHAERCRNAAEDTCTVRQVKRTRIEKGSVRPGPSIRRVRVPVDKPACSLRLKLTGPSACRGTPARQRSQDLVLLLVWKTLPPPK